MKQYPWKEEDEKRAISEAVEEALKFAHSRYSIVLRDHLTDENFAEVRRVFSDRLNPFIRHIKSSRTFSEDDVQMIVRKSQEDG